MKDNVLVLKQIQVGSIKNPYSRIIKLLVLHGTFAAMDAPDTFGEM